LGEPVTSRRRYDAIFIGQIVSIAINEGGELFPGLIPLSQDLPEDIVGTERICTSRIPSYFCLLWKRDQGLSVTLLPLSVCRTHDLNVTHESIDQTHHPGEFLLVELALLSADAKADTVWPIKAPLFSLDKERGSVQPWLLCAHPAVLAAPFPDLLHSLYMQHHCDTFRRKCRGPQRVHCLQTV
jgi:hypothetical protein